MTPFEKLLAVASGKGKYLTWLGNDWRNRAGLVAGEVCRSGHYAPAFTNASSEGDRNCGADRTGQDSELRIAS